MAVPTTTDLLNNSFICVDGPMVQGPATSAIVLGTNLYICVDGPFVVNEAAGGGPTVKPYWYYELLRRTG